MSALYRYEVDTGLRWAAVLLEHSRLFLLFSTNYDKVLQASISLEEVRSAVASEHGGMLSFGEQNLSSTGSPSWLDLHAKAHAAGVTIPNLIKDSLQDNYSVRLLVPRKNVVSMQNCNLIFYMRPKAVLLSEKQATTVSGPLESARLLNNLVSSYNATLPA
jgi:hypothetical protein